MLLGELPALEETQSGKDLIRIGRDRGRVEGRVEGQVGTITRLVQANWGAAPRSVLSQIEKLSSAQCDDLVDFLVQCDSLAELQAWLKRAKR